MKKKQNNLLFNQCNMTKIISYLIRMKNMLQLGQNLKKISDNKLKCLEAEQQSNETCFILDINLFHCGLIIQKLNQDKPHKSFRTFLKLIGICRSETIAFIQLKMMYLLVFSFLK